MPLLGAALLNGRLVPVDEVPRGAACGCVCPACGEPVIAKQGDCRIHHFAHDGGRACRYAAETLAHRLAKEVLAQFPELHLPAVYAFPRLGKLLAPERRVRFDRVELEARLGGLVPDVTAYSGSYVLIVEIVVTHPPGLKKIRELAGMGISSLCIHLGRSPAVDFETVRDAITATRNNRVWLFNRKAAQARSVSRFRALSRVQCVDGPTATYQLRRNYYAWFPVP